MEKVEKVCQNCKEMYDPKYRDFVYLPLAITTPEKEIIDLTNWCIKCVMKVESRK